MIQNSKPAQKLYRRAWIGLIPLIGGIAGIVFIILGLGKYKDKKLITIGFLCLLFTICFYGFLYYLIGYSNFGGKLMREPSISKLNLIVNEIEFYKIKQGVYPDSLQQLPNYSKDGLGIDPILSRRPNEKNVKFNYKKIGDGYTLFSSGVDRIPNSVDDIYPSATSYNHDKYGLKIK